MDELGFHESYTFPDADLVLSSKNGTKFRVDSLILKRASGFFRGMLEMQRDPNEKHDEPIQMDEGEDLVKVMLDIIYPDRALAPSDITSFAFMHDLAVIFIEKYDVPAGVASLRSLYHDSRSPSLPPIKMFGLAERFGWIEEADVASSATLAVDLHATDSQAQLETLTAHSALQLLNLHRKRKLALLDDLKSICSIRIDWKYFVNHYSKCCWETVLESADWIVLLHAVSEELEMCSLGTKLSDPAFWNRPDISRLWQRPCSSGCSARLLNKDKFVKAVCNALDSLPKTTSTPILFHCMLSET
ncbi:hypothetical protein DFH11DRAFT_1611439 [Phellopilus nigrolimitatus]|nr:hypothetical protein DFH11DRAFT_1611439 [Phellopilus nigrolimitatus]